MAILTCPKCGNDSNWPTLNADPDAGFASGTCGDCGTQVYDPNYDGPDTYSNVTVNGIGVIGTGNSVNIQR